MTGEYLSEIIDKKDIKASKLNLIYSPCGSGKTTFARTVLANMKINPWGLNLLYLIDGKIGKEQLLRSDGAVCFENMWTGKEEWHLPGITVMTYAGYAILNQKAPEHDVWREDSLIVCDELHNLVKWAKWKNEDNVHEYALDLLKERIKVGNNTLVALSATPTKIKDEFNYCLNEIPLRAIPRHYENESIIYYNNLSLLINKLKRNQRGLIFIARIKEMLKYKGIADKKGLRTAALWSVNNLEYPLDDEQLQIQKYIVEHREIPEKIDVLFVNKAFETSISIGNETQSQNLINFMIVHTSDTDTQVQVRGRYRNDLQELYLYERASDNTIELDQEWLCRPLYKQDKILLATQLGFKDDNGRLMKWTSLKPKIVSSGYIVKDKRTNSQRYSIITTA